MRAIRLAVTALLPTAVGFLVLGLPVAQLVFGFGRGARDAGYVGGALMALAIGLVPFTIQYICLRAFYALEDTRTTFFLQCLIAGANVALGVATVFLLDRPSLVATGLAASYSAAYLIGVVVSFGRLRRRLPDLNADELIRHCVRLLLAVAPGAAVAWLLTWVLTAGSTGKPMLAVVLVSGRTGGRRLVPGHRPDAQDPRGERDRRAVDPLPRPPGRSADGTADPRPERRH